MIDGLNDQFPVLQGRRNRSVDNEKVDEVRRVLWRAFQHGGLTEEEFASTLERLEFSASPAESRSASLRETTQSRSS